MFLIIKSPSEIRMTSEFLGVMFQNMGYCSGTLIQNFLMLSLHDNCCLMPLVHLVLTANLDYL